MDESECQALLTENRLLKQKLAQLGESDTSQVIVIG